VNSLEDELGPSGGAAGGTAGGTAGKDMQRFHLSNEQTRVKSKGISVLTRMVGRG